MGAFESESGCAWREADRQLRRIAKRRAALDAEESRWLLIAKRENVHAQLGYGSFVEYVERVLGHRRQVAIERLRIAEAMEELPMIKRALATGAACYSAVRELTRFATPETEQAWLDTIENKTVHEIEDLAAGRKRGDLGFPPAIAKAAVERARPHTGADVALPDVIRACLRACPRPTG